jgi:4-hydroxy-2-oxoheptanedioate aldolase
VQSAEEAQRAVAATRFGSVADYFVLAVDYVCVMVKLETGEALSRLDEIAAVEGIDSIFVGPNDLAADLGHLGQPDHPEVRQAIAAAARCRALGKPCGILAADVTRARDYLEAGVTWVATGSDLGLMMTGARNNLAALRAGSKLS